MKTFFPGYYPLEGEDSNDFWKEGYIVLDDSFLLGLFRLNDADRDSIMNILEKDSIKTKLWIPYDVAWAYHYFLNAVLLGQINSIKRLQVLLQESLSVVSSKACYPYFEQGVIEQTTQLFNRMKEICEQQIERHKQALYSCDFKNRVNQLFKDRIGSPYDSVQLEELYKQGEDRYAKRVPPGYTVDPFHEKRLRFHGFIVWEQMKKQANESRKNIILCTGRITEDWFYLVDGLPVISNCHLVNEFQENTGRSFRCYSLKLFLNECKEHGLITEQERNSVADSLSVSYDFSPNDSASTTESTSANS